MLMVLSQNERIIYRRKIIFEIINKMVEALGVEPRSEKEPHSASTCLSRL